MTKSVVEYSIITAESSAKLATCVNAAIHNEGFQPIGGVTANPTTGLYMQAMVRYEEPSGIWPSR